MEVPTLQEVQEQGKALLEKDLPQLTEWLDEMHEATQRSVRLPLPDGIT